jgi:hypothetical protein
MAQGQQRPMADANANERHESLRHALEDDCRANKHLLCPRDDDDCFVVHACPVGVGISDCDNAFAAELVAAETPETSCPHRCCPVPNYEELSPYRTSSCCDVFKNSSRRKGESRLSRRSLLQCGDSQGKRRSSALHNVQESQHGEDGRQNLSVRVESHRLEFGERVAPRLPEAKHINDTELTQITHQLPYSRCSCVNFFRSGSSSRLLLLADL